MNYPRGKFILASFLLVCVSVALWFSFKDYLLLKKLQHEQSAKHPEPLSMNTTLPHTCPAPLVCPVEEILTCPEPFSPDRMSEQMFSANATADGQASRTPWIEANNKQLRGLFECLENRNCGQNQAKIVILGTHHFSDALRGATDIHNVWARAIMKALHGLGFTYLVTHNHQGAVQLYQMFPDLVRAVFFEPKDVRTCFNDREYCVLSEENPDGIPIWKIFSFHFWPDAQHPLGGRWTLQPEDYTLEHPEWQKNTYIGYSVEEQCHSRRFIPTEERNKQAYVMTKSMRNFVPGPETAWPADFYGAASQELGIQFMTGANHQDGDLPVELPAGIVNLGQMAQIDFLHHIAFSQVLVGLGSPSVPATPYEALCLGVPFINPILEWDHENPSDKYRWKSQHGQLALLEPPYVYNVRRDDREGFIKAIKDAVANPIPSYILPRMRVYSVGWRLNELIHSNWERDAAAVLERRKKGEEQGPLFVV